MSLVERAPWLTINDDAERTFDSLAALLNRPAWQADAACLEHPEVTFFLAGHGGSYRPAKAVCASCLVRDECLAFAMADDTIEGFWGGTSEQERSVLRRREQVA